MPDGDGLASAFKERRQEHSCAMWAGDTVTGDVLDPPGRRAEQDVLAGPGLEHHLLVELADLTDKIAGLITPLFTRIANHVGEGDLAGETG